jgi:hypothetical protein
MVQPFEDLYRKARKSAQIKNADYVTIMLGRGRSHRGPPLLLPIRQSYALHLHRVVYKRLKTGLLFNTLVHKPVEKTGLWGS